MALVFALVSLATLSGCSSSSAGPGTPTAAQGTSTALPKLCASGITNFSMAFTDGQNLSGYLGVPGDLPAGIATPLSNFVYPLGIPDENAVGNAPAPAMSVFSPDASHLATAIEQAVPFTEEYDPYVVDTATHAVTKIPLPSPIEIANSDRIPRMLTWADNHTLIIFANPSLSGDLTGPAYSYDLTTSKLTPLPKLRGAIEGVVRCGVVFYLTVGAFSPLSPADANQTQVAGTYINRYDLSTNTAIGAPIKIGEASTWAGAEGTVDYAGWDVSQDGLHIAYQTEHVTAGPTIASTWFAANADGTGAVTILEEAPLESRRAHGHLARMASWWPSPRPCPWGA